MQIQIFQIDAFTEAAFGGNPAAVCPLEHWLGDDFLQSIALENNLSETEINTFKDFLFEERKVSELSILQNSLKENASIVRKNLSGS